METTIYNQSGKETGKLKLPEGVFGLPWNGDLVHQVVVAMQTNRRTPVAHTKDRSDVSGGGKKPWQQKGTGRARHGSSRSPIWVGGGVAHGPRNEKNFSRKINQKAKAKALFTIISKKFSDGEILFVDDLKFDAMKTKTAREVLGSLSKIKGYGGLITKRANSALVVSPSTDKNFLKSFSNISNIRTSHIRNINPVDILNFRYLVLAEPKACFDFLSGKLKSRTVLAEKCAAKAESPTETLVEAKKPTAKKVTKDTKPKKA